MNPYKIDSFLDLMRYAYNLGWYGGTKNLFVLTCEGRFEGWSGRATESWDCRFHITSDEIIFQTEGRKIPAIDVYGDTVEEACKKVLLELQKIPTKAEETH